MPQTYTSSAMDIGNTIGSSFDVAIIGGGAAGCAAAITSASAGLSTIVFDATASPARRPGEALHPGVEGLFRQLGILDDVADYDPVRHSGIQVTGPSGSVFLPFGSDDVGQWRGYQIERRDLDSMLRKRAMSAGAEVLQGTRVSRALSASEGWALETCRGVTNARFVIDAAGPSHWLTRQLELPLTRMSPRLIARYGYAETTHEMRNPELTEDAAGWSWKAFIRPGVVQWVGLPFFGDAQLPAPVGMRLRGADVTWRVVESCAGNNYFLVGDAAAVLDPACSHGVLRALMSGIFAATLCSAVLTRNAPSEAASAEYRRWLLDWVCRDGLELIRRYAQMPRPPEWLGLAATICSEIWSVACGSHSTMPS